jgi:hypothetical protein
VDRQQQTARVQRIADAIAQRTIELPPDERTASIRIEVAKVRDVFGQAYTADARLTTCAMEAGDSMAGWIEAPVHALESDG